MMIFILSVYFLSELPELLDDPSAVTYTDITVFYCPNVTGEYSLLTVAACSKSSPVCTEIYATSKAPFDFVWRKTADGMTFYLVIYQGEFEVINVAFHVKNQIPPGLIAV